MAISPGAYSKITDKSGYVPSGLIAGFFGLFPFASLRGEDNILKLKTDLPNLIAEYSEPAYGKYGLSQLMAANWLRGGSAAYACRLLPDDATYANIKLTATDTSASVPASSIEWSGFFAEATSFTAAAITLHNDIYYENTSGVAQTGAFDPAAWTQIAVNFTSTSSYVLGDYVVESGSLYKANTTVAQGSVFNPAQWDVVFHRATGNDLIAINATTNQNYTSLANIEADLLTDTTAVGVFYAIGRGSDYNKLSMSISLNTALTNTYAFKMYDIQFFDLDSNGFQVPIESTYTVSFDPDATDLTGESLFYVDQINQYSNVIKVIAKSENIEDILFPSLQLYTDPNVAIEDSYQYDFLGNVDSVVTSFSSGSEGSFINAQGRFDQAAFESSVRDLFLGLIDPRITNFKEIQSKVIFSANFETATKLAMSDFTQNIRSDVFFYSDMGMLANEEQALTSRSTALTMDNYKASVQAGDFEVFDTFSGKYIRVPALYQVAYNISASWRQNGVHVPVAGYNPRGTILGIKPGSMSFNPNRTYLDLFYLSQINPIIRDPSGSFRMGTLTTQKKSSAMSNESVVNMIQVMDVELSLFSERYLFEFITPEVLDDIRNRITDYFQKWYRNNGVESVEVNVYASALDKKQKTIRVDVTVFPTSFIEKLLLNFIIK